MKSKTVALWLTLLAGPLGLHRVYLLGRFDSLAATLASSSLLGLYGVYRTRNLGVDDQVSWLLIPLLGFTMAGCALSAIVFGLMSVESWNRRFNPDAPEDSPQGNTDKLTVAGLVTALFVGTSILMATLAFSFQHYFEFQIAAISVPSVSRGP